MPEPDCFLRYRMYALLRGILRRENPGAPLQRAVVLKWFYLLSHGNTFVGGKCALPSALLVCIITLLWMAVADFIANACHVCQVVGGASV